MRVIWLAALILLFSGRAFAECEKRPAAIDNYLQAHPGTALVTVADLVPDDQRLWVQAHHELCPGYAVVDWDGSGRKATAFTILSGMPGDRKQSVLLIRPGGSIVTVVGPSPFAYPGVVWRTGAGPLRDIQTGKKVVMAHDGVVFEYIDAAATVFYSAKGKIRAIQISD